MRRIATCVLACFFLFAPLGFAVDVVSLKSNEGIEAWFVEDHTVPIIALAFSIEGGAREDPKGKEGLSSLVAQMLGRGAGAYDEAALSELLDTYGIRLSFQVSRDGLTGQIETLSANRETAFELMRLVLTQPRFDQETFARVRNEHLASLALEAHSARTAALQTWFQNAFPHHSYATPPQGTVSAVEALTVEEVRGHLSRLIRRRALRISVVGDISPQEAAEALDVLFGSLPATPAPERRQAQAHNMPQEIFVPRRATQTVMVFGHTGPLREDEDFIAATLLAYILGGGSTSRLFEKVREEHGLAYAVWCQMLPYQEAGVFLGGLATHPTHAAEALALVRHEMTALAQGQITPQDLAAAKAYFIGNYPLRFVSSARSARYLTTLQRAGWEIGYLSERQSLFEQITLQDIRRAARRFLHPENLLVVSVGPEEKGDGTPL